MGFKTLLDLDCEVTTAIGGMNKQTGKANPKTIQGYFIGSRSVDSAKSKTGKAFLHILQTEKGNVGVWGKTNLDNKLCTVSPGSMVRITNTGMVPTQTGNDMYKYKVEVDSDDVLDTSTLVTAPAAANENSSEDSSDDGESDEVDATDEEPATDEVRYNKPIAKGAQVSGDAAARKARVEALLNKGKRA